MMMVSDKNYVVGWLDSSVNELLSQAPPSSSLRYALITCLDSNPQPAELLSKSPELKSIAGAADVVGDGILVRTDILIDAAARKPIFFGFDEVCFFPAKSIEPKPRGISWVGPVRISQERFNRMSKWLNANSCSLALGGGEGLNFIVRTPGLVKFLLGFSIKQPHGSLAGTEGLAATR